MIPEIDSVPRSELKWPTCYRVIPSRFPPIQLFERVADPEDLEAVFAIEALTNDRLRDEVGELRLVRPEERVTGAGAGYIMAAFTHISPSGGRFTAGFGAYYAARDLRTSIDETVHHRASFLRATREGPMELDMRVLRARLRGMMHDIRGRRKEYPEIYDPGDHTASRWFATRVRAAGSDGIAYDSLRHEGGECVAVFRPKCLSRCHQAQHLTYVWNGERIATVYEKRMLR